MESYRAFKATIIVTVNGIDEKANMVVDLLHKPFDYTTDQFENEFLRALVRRYGSDAQIQLSTLKVHTIR